MHSNIRRVVRFGASLLVMGLSCTALAQDNAAADAWRRLQLTSDQLVALYLEAAAIHNGFAYTIEFARFQDCAQAQNVVADLDTPTNRLKPLRQITKALRYANRFLFAMEPELREQVRSMSDGERTGLVKLASGECLIAEMIEYQQKPMPDPKDLGPLLALLVDRGWLPHPDQLERDPKMVSRTYANKIRGAADVLAAPANFDVNTRRSDGYTILTHALLLNQADVVRAALNHGADPNLCGPRFCPIQLAMTMRNEQQARELVDLLLQAGADPNQVDRTQRARLVPLATAAGRDLRFVEQLIKAGAKPNGIPDASAPIFFAAANGKQDILDYLVTQGADLFAHDSSRPAPRNTVYTAAQETKNPLFIEWIEKRIVETAAKSGKYKCELWLEQDGRRVVASGGEYRLKRAPFRIVVRFAEPDGHGVLLASAQKPAFQQDVRERTPESAVFRPISIAAEEGEGKSDWLLVLSADASTKDGTTQYWHWASESDRRFTGRRGSGQALEFYKDIRAIGIDQASGPGKFQPAPVSDYAGGDIYIVAAVPVELSVFDQRFIEPMMLKLTFTDSTRRASR